MTNELNLETMTTFNVTITGQQQHIRGMEFENQTAAQVEAIIHAYWDQDEIEQRPKLDGNTYELCSDKNILIEAVNIVI